MTDTLDQAAASVTEKAEEIKTEVQTGVAGAENAANAAEETVKEIPHRAESHLKAIEDHALSFIDNIGIEAVAKFRELVAKIREVL